MPRLSRLQAPRRTQGISSSQTEEQGQCTGIEEDNVANEDKSRPPVGLVRSALVKVGASFQDWGGEYRGRGFFYK